jgi:lysophospholipase L1-like esterase
MYKNRKKKFRIWGGFITTQVLALAALAAPIFAANETNYTYLGLGDSIAFGFNPTLFPPFAPNLPTPTPAQFTGYPEVVAQVEHLLKSKKEVNAACPGETSGSFWISGAQDNGCNSFKTNFGLHTNYSGTQLQFALSQLASNKHISLVTLGIGGNDLLLLEEQCSAPSVPSFSDCVLAQLGTPQAPGVVMQSYAANLGAILKAIRADYSGTLVLVNNYAPSADPLFVEAIEFLDGVMMEVGANFGVKVADGFTAFQMASALFPSPIAPHNGDPCAAGLLIRLSATTCDVHPSPAGRDLLAATIVLATQGAKLTARRP